MRPLKTLHNGVNVEKRQEASNSNSTDTASPPTLTTSAESSIDNEELTTDTAGDAEQAFTRSMSVTSTTPTSYTTIRPRQRAAQNFLLLWVDASIDETDDNCQHVLAQLRSVFNDVDIFIQPELCIQFLYGIENVRAFIVTSGSLGQRLVPDIHELPQVDAIHIFCGNKSRHEQWVQEWVKIKGVHIDIKPICEALQLAVKQFDQDSIALSFVTMDEATSSQNLNQLEPSFMYTQIFKEILFEIEYDEKSIKDLADYCCKLYSNNRKELDIIGEFEHTYRSKSPLWWYTRECFTYQMLNRALRTLEGNTIINMGFFIHDLHEQLEQLYQEQVGAYHGESFMVYRGQGLLETDFDILVKSKGGLMSFNNFLSTSKNQDVSLRFAKNALTKTGMVGILFIMTIDPLVSSAPFASIREVSYYKTEEEILFSMHTVFRINEITKIDNNNLLYQVDLKLTSDDDQQLRTLTTRIREEVVGETGWKRLGQLLVKLEQFDKAEELYNVLLEQTSDEGEKAIYYNNLGFIRNQQGDYKKAIEYHEKGLEIEEKTLPLNHPSLATSYNNIGMIYNNMGEYSQALSFYEKALDIFKQTLPSNHPSLATSYNNIGIIYDNMGEYSKALLFFEKAHEIKEKTLPLNHPDLATSYNNIGSVYDNMEEYSKALSFYEKTRAIFEKTLPRNHPDLAASYNNMGEVYGSMEEYSQALSFYEKALEIWQKTLPPEHPLLATSYNNIGLVYYNIGESSKALSYYEQAFKIWQQTLSLNHPNLAISYTNIAGVYDNIKEHSKALSFYEQALEIFEITLPPNHPSLATTYKNIGSVYDHMKEYSQALSFYEKALEIQQQTLPSNHPDLATAYDNIGSMYNNMGEYLKALSFYEKACEIEEETLPPFHPDLAISYGTIGGMYYHMGEYSKAVLFYEKALEIKEKNLPLNHPDLAASYTNIGTMCLTMEEYSKALSFYEKAHEINQKTLPTDHLDFAYSCNNIAGTYFNMGEYSKALLNFELVLTIFQTSLPPDHPSIKTVQTSIEYAKKKL